jgi:hypothetical protein
MADWVQRSISPTVSPVPPDYSKLQRRFGEWSGYAGNVRTASGARTPYAEQWILSVERQVGKGGKANIAYVGNRAMHLLSAMTPYNYIPLQDLSLGNSLYDTFQPGRRAWMV